MLDWRLAKQAAVFSIESIRAFISNLEGESHRVHIIGEHPCCRDLQSDLFLVLLRHRCRVLGVADTG